jgi:WD40 repeat protein
VHTLGHTCTGTCICTTEADSDGDEELVWNPECPVAGHSATVLSVDFSPDGKQFVSGSEDNFVKIWDVATGALVSSLVGLRGVW